MRALGRVFAIVSLATLAALLALLGAQVASALFTSSGSAQATVASATMPGPGTLDSEQVGCKRGGSPEVELQWSVGSPSYASSYAVERAGSSGGPYTRVATLPIGALSYTDAGSALSTTSTYYYRVSALYQSWSGASPVSAVTTLNKQCR